MRSVRISLDERTFERLETERRLLGFEDREAYLQWVVENRAAIDQGTERDQLLSAYADRVEELEARLADERRFEGNFSPERVERITDERLAEDANVLNGVEGQRIDEMARRAVARTRERLGRSVGTGLSYRSRTALEEGLTPGADVADLESIDVPGYDDDVVTARREAVGAALAFLRDEGRARRSDFVDELFEQYPARYDTQAGWWRCIKRGLKQVPDVDGGAGARVWEYTPLVSPDRRGVTVTRISNE